jgi:starvation-inducible DNA-binding protein
MATHTTHETGAAANKRFHTRNGIATENRVKLIALLNQFLAAEMDLYSQTKYAHWNVKGANFIGLHKLFDELAEQVEHHIDMVAERATSLGGVAHGTLRQTAAATRVAEFPDEIFNSHDVTEALADRFATVANAAREAIDRCMEFGDAASADLFTEVVRELDEALYFLEAHLQG